jgi:hypothetical protein
VQRWLLVAAVLIALAGAVWLMIDEPAAGVPDRQGATEPSLEPGRGDRAVISAVMTGAITGKVVMPDGTPATARVFVKATTSLSTQSLDDGAFRFDGLPPEPIFLSASQGSLASDILGPFVIEVGKALDGVVLTLKPTITIQGVVRDLVTRAPLRGAVIGWSGGMTQTSGEGTFQIAAPKSQVWLDVSAKGYLSRTEWVSLELARAGGKLDLSLSPLSAIEGVVLEQGTPRAGVSVWAELTEGLRRGERSAMTVTNGKGEFRLECSEGLRRMVAITPTGVTSPGPEVRVAIGEIKKGITIELGDLGNVTGVVRKDGTPLAGAVLTLVNAQSEDSVATGATILDGRFVFQAVPVGSYLVQVKAGAFSAIAGPFVHRDDGQPWSIDVAGGKTLRGRVEPASAGVRVRWRSGDWSGPSNTTVTAADGSFSFEGVPSARVLVDAEGPEGAATVTASPEELVVLRLEKGAALVRVIDESGASVGDAVIVARSDETGAVRKYVLMAPDGVFQIELPRGRWVLLAEVSGRGRTQGQAVVIAGAPVDVTLSLTATTSVTGRVIDRSSRLPISNANVRAESSMGKVSVTTDARGTFTLPPQPKQVALVVGRDGFEPQSFYLPSRPDASNLTIELQPAPNRPYSDEAPRFEGVGMTLKAENGRVLVGLVNEGSPAERAGVRAGDAIILIDGAPAGADMQQVVSRIRGPAGTSVRIGFEREGRPLEMVMRRRSLLITYW